MASNSKLEALEKIRERVDILQYHELQRSLISPNPLDLIKANDFIAKFKNNNKEKEEEGSVGKFDPITPIQFQNLFGYKDRPIMLSYKLLRNMARTPIPGAIIRTRVNQIANFSIPQNDIYSIGYKIQKKKKPGQAIEDWNKLSYQEEKDIYEIMEFFNNCGVSTSYDSKTFDSFLRSIARDSLTFDQYTWENIFNRKGEITSFVPVDAATIRISDSIDPQIYEEYFIKKGVKPKEKKFGYYPSHIQLYNSQAIVEFYPWQLSFGVRNPTTDLESNGYGLSEIEDMVGIITSLLWGHSYNQNVFKNGSMPSGFFRISGNINGARLAEFRNAWAATMQSVTNSHRIPIVPGDKVDFVPLNNSNKDMEYNSWMEFNIKLASAIFTIDPAEFNFPLNGSSADSSLFKGSDEYKTENSKNKGLYPILRNLSLNINRSIMRNLKNGEYEFSFSGLDSMTPESEQELMEKRVKSYMMIDEVRALKNLKPLPDGVGQTILDGSLIVQKGQKEMMEQQNQAMSDGQGYEDEDDGGEDDNSTKDFDVQKAFNNLFLK